MVIKKYYSDKKILNILLNNNSVNSINYILLHELVKVIDEVDNSDIRCLIISSLNKNFCAGADLKERQDFDKNDTINFLDELCELLKRIENLGAVTIASINGACLGGGLELALACDFRVSAKNAFFSFPETSIGIIPGAGGTQRMVKLFGIPLSMKWIFSAEKYNANDAYYDGIIDYIIEDKSLDKFSLELANKIIQNAPISLKSAKSAILSAQYNEGFLKERKEYINTLDSKDRNEGLLSFNEKRSPNWKNK